MRPVNADRKEERGLQTLACPNEHCTGSAMQLREARQDPNVRSLRLPDGDYVYRIVYTLFAGCASNLL